MRESHIPGMAKMMFLFSVFWVDVIIGPNKKIWSAMNPYGLSHSVFKKRKTYVFKDFWFWLRQNDMDIVSVKQTGLRFQQ